MVHFLVKYVYCFQTGEMDILGTARVYIKEMVALAGPQMKVILMDKETVCCSFCILFHFYVLMNM